MRKGSLQDEKCERPVKDVGRVDVLQASQDLKCFQYINPFILQYTCN